LHKEAAVESDKGELLSTPVFDVARNTMNLIYNQTIVWLGFFYCPPLPLLLVIRYFLTFLFNKVGNFSMVSYSRLGSQCARIG
jgi:hypothetical protein